MMISPELDNLARIGKRKREGADGAEISGLWRSGIERILDPCRERQCARLERAIAIKLVIACQPG